MKHLIAAIAGLAMILCLFTGCGGTDPRAGETESVELVVFAAASMTEALTELGNRYMDQHPDVAVGFNFDSSGTLKTQIQEGANCDIFISAGQKQMDELDITADAVVNTDGLDFILEGTRLDMLENKVVLAVPEDNPAGINSYDDMIAGLKAGEIMLAMGNSDVPVGQYSQRILHYYGLMEGDLAAAGVITYGSNAKEVTTQVSEGTVDCGMIYRTDAFSAGLTAVDTASADLCGKVIYPAAVMKGSKNPEAAREFLNYIADDTGDEMFASVGFVPVA